jgi:hypothetical protein
MVVLHVICIVEKSRIVGFNFVGYGEDVYYSDHKHQVNTKGKVQCF